MKKNNRLELHICNRNLLTANWYADDPYREIKLFGMLLVQAFVIDFKYQSCWRKLGV